MPRTLAGWPSSGRSVGTRSATSRERSSGWSRFPSRWWTPSPNPRLGANQRRRRTVEQQRFHGNWNGEDDVFESFFRDIGYGDEAKPNPEKAKARATVSEILFASYGNGDYCGDAMVLFRGVDGELYEVYGSHCSCHGL